MSGTNKLIDNYQLFVTISSKVEKLIWEFQMDSLKDIKFEFVGGTNLEDFRQFPRHDFATTYVDAKQKTLNILEGFSCTDTVRYAKGMYKGAQNKNRVSKKHYNPGKHNNCYKNKSRIEEMRMTSRNIL